MKGSLLIPSIENRIASWLDINRKVKLAQAEQVRYTITISREYGCFAYPLAAELKKLLDNEVNNWTIFDKLLIEEVAQNSEFSERILEQVGESYRYMDAFVATFQQDWKKDIDGYKALWRHILGAARQGNAIIIGRGSSFITKELDNCFQFHLTASKAHRVTTVAKRDGLSKEDALEKLEQREEQRHLFLKKFLQQEGYDPSIYHMIFNNEYTTPQRVARMIVEYLREQTHATDTFELPPRS